MPLASDILQKVSFGAQQVKDAVAQGIGNAGEFVRKNPVTSSASVAGGLLATGTIIQIARKRRKAAPSRKKAKRKTVKRKSSSRRKTSKKKSTRKLSRKKIRMTKNGQPYIILANGRARFISKKSAKLRRSRKGGFF